MMFIKKYIFSTQWIREMNKLNAITCSIVLSVFLCAAQAVANNQEALANERLPVDRYLLEKQWGVNCTAAVSLTLAWMDDQQGRSVGDWEMLPWRDLKYCGLLFNTPDTGRYQSCPDYSKAYRLLSAMRQGEAVIDIPVLAAVLSERCN
jgi:hypothetical protein